MKRIGSLFIYCIITSFTGIIAQNIPLPPDPSGTDPLFDQSQKANWSIPFVEVDIPSPIDGTWQKAFYYASESDESKPLIVSLHTWSGHYAQPDSLAFLCVERQYNYIHPDFRGPNDKPEACCSEWVIADIEAAIGYALEHSKVRPSGIYLIGVSGGGYATLCMLLKSTFPITKYSAWVPVTDLIAWYGESIERNNKYSNDILNCTGTSGSVLDTLASKNRSPMHQAIPRGKLDSAKVSIFTGIYDGIKGSVPITHSLLFYNRILAELKAGEENRVSQKEIDDLLNHKTLPGESGSIGNRAVLLSKSHKGIKLIVFDGEHEMLTEYALRELLAP